MIKILIGLSLLLLTGCSSVPNREPDLVNDRVNIWYVSSEYVQADNYSYPGLAVEMILENTHDEPLFFIAVVEYYIRAGQFIDDEYVISNGRYDVGKYDDYYDSDELWEDIEPGESVRLEYIFEFDTMMPDADMLILDDNNEIADVFMFEVD